MYIISNIEKTDKFRAYSRHEGCSIEERKYREKSSGVHQKQATLKIF